MNIVNQKSNWTRYNRTPKIFSCAQQQFSPPKILSFGCSSGEETRTLRDLYFPQSEIHGFDIDPNLILENIQRNDAGIKYFSEMSQLDTDYDLIFCMSVLCRWPEDQEAYKFEMFQRTLLNIDARLKVGGRLVIYNPQYLLNETFLRHNYCEINFSGLENGFVRMFHRDGRQKQDMASGCVFVKTGSLKREYGVIWANTSNVGDDIQTIAALQFLSARGVGKIKLYNREALRTQHLNSTDPTFVIMNGWFMHNVNMFPPPEHVVPVFISFHCAHEALIQIHKQYFLAHAPIGCRDVATVEIFRRNGIDAFFTGCLTLTLEKSRASVKNPKRLAVDLNTCPYIPPVEFSEEVLKDYEPISHELPATLNRNDPLARLRLAHSLLDLYQNSEEIVTTRLHCALPCRAFGTPVKFIHSNLSDSRFSGLLEILGGSHALDECRATVAIEGLQRIREGFNRMVI